jgi:hypothetical protein
LPNIDINHTFVVYYTHTASRGLVSSCHLAGREVLL